MYSFVSTGALNGIESYLATVEVDASTGLPGFEMVGMLNAEIKEAKERVRVALKNTGKMQVFFKIHILTKVKLYTTKKMWYNNS